jgi:hypothetical protein
MSFYNDYQLVSTRNYKPIFTNAIFFWMIRLNLTTKVTIFYPYNRLRVGNTFMGGKSIDSMKMTPWFSYYISNLPYKTFIFMLFL